MISLKKTFLSCLIEMKVLEKPSKSFPAKKLHNFRIKCDCVFAQIHNFASFLKVLHRKVGERFDMNDVNSKMIQKTTTITQLNDESTFFSHKKFFTLQFRYQRELYRLLTNLEILMPILYEITTQILFLTKLSGMLFILRVIDIPNRNLLMNNGICFGEKPQKRMSFLEKWEIFNLRANWFWTLEFRLKRIRLVDSFKNRDEVAKKVAIMTKLF